MIRTYLVRGLLAGLIAGCVAFGVAKVLGEQQVGHAIAFETATSKARHEPQQPDVVSRDVQSTIGLFTGLVVDSVALGGIFGLLSAFAIGRLGGHGTRRDALMLATGTFVVLYLVPFLKYPANPPAVGNPDTIGHRTALYFSLLLVSVAAAVLALWLRPRFERFADSWNAGWLAAGVFVVMVGVAYLLLPAVNEVPRNFPAATLWKFRLSSVATQLTVWTTVGVAFGWMTHRSEVAVDEIDVRADARPGVRV